MAPKASDDVTDLSDLTPAERYDVLTSAARLAAEGLYANVVLSTYQQFHTGRVDRWTREVADAVTSGRTSAIVGPNDDLLAAVLRAGDRLEPGRRLQPADVDRELAPGWGRPYFPTYLADRLAERGGQPPADPKHWMQMYVRAQTLCDHLRDGVYADIKSGTAPPELSEGLGRQALAVRRSEAALRRHQVAADIAQGGVDDARRDLGLGYGAGAVLLGSGIALGVFVDPAAGGMAGGPGAIFLVTAIAKSGMLAVKANKRGVAGRQVATAERAVAEATQDYGRALGPVWADEPSAARTASPPKQQPRRGR